MRSRGIAGGMSIVVAAVVAAVLMVGCAKQAYPTGGPKDETPPRVVATAPANASRHFEAKQFYIEFDEYVELKDATNNVLVSPPMKQKPEFSTKGRGVLVRIKDTLQPNTTYLFQFKDAIADFNEGNLLSSYEYVFSTGERMDTMQLAGRVVDALTGKPWGETVSVMAFSTSDAVEDDTIATHEQPAFVTRCNKEGAFAFHYIPQGEYRIVALADKNKNLRVDVDEAAAWWQEPVASTDSIDTLQTSTLQMSMPRLTTQRLMKGEFTARGRILIVTRMPMKHPSLTGESVEWRLNAKGDTMTVWCRNPYCDSTQIVLTDEGLNDTLRLRFRPAAKGKNAPSMGGGKSTPLIVPRCSGNSGFYDRLLLDFTNPIVQVADSAYAIIFHEKDSAREAYPIKLDSTGLHAQIEATLKSGENYKATIPSALFTDMYGTANDSVSFTLTPKDYGTITLHLLGAGKQSLVVEVLDKKDTVVARQHLLSDTVLHFSHLEAGDYRLRVIIDQNGDHQWTPGNYRTGQQPERVIYYSKPLHLRERWGIEERWSLRQEPPAHLSGTLQRGAKLNIK